MSDTTEVKPQIMEFSSTLLSNQYHFGYPGGGTAIFFNGRYRTDNPEEIKELKSEVDKRNPYINSYREVDALKEDPLAALRAKLKQEVLEEFKKGEARATNPNNDMGGNVGSPGAFGASNTNASLATLASDTSTEGTPKVTLPFAKIGK